jgi:hypothetical protein
MVGLGDRNMVISMLDSKTLMLTFPFNASTIAAVKRCGATWHALSKTWRMELWNAPILVREMGGQIELHPDAVAPVMDECEKGVQSTLRLIEANHIDTPVIQEWRQRHGV